MLRVLLIALQVTVFVSYPAWAFAEDFQFLLGEYKTPNLRRNSLELTLGLNGQDDYLKEKGYPWSNKNHDYNLFGGFALDFEHYRDLEKLQRDYRITANIGVNLTGNNDSEESSASFNPYRGEVDIDEKEFSTRQEIRLSNRFYRHKTYFYELGLDIDNAYSLSYVDIYRSSTPERDPYYYYDDDNRRLHEITIQLPLALGRGRMYRVEDVRMALYILEDLQKKGILTQTPDRQTINDFAQLLSHLKNERVFDHRIKTAYEIDRMHAFLSDHRLVENAGSVYFTTLYDNVLFANNPVRYSGAYYSIGVVPTYARANLNRDYKSDGSQGIHSSETHQTENSPGIFGRFRIGSEKALNNWQISTKFTGQYGYEKNEFSFQKDASNGLTEIHEYTFNPTVFQLDVAGGIAYYPNSRNSFTLSISSDYLNKSSAVSYVERFESNGNSDEYKSKNPARVEETHINGDLTWIHYLSLKSTIQLSYQFLYRHDFASAIFEQAVRTYPYSQYTEKTTTRNHQLNLILSYNIF